MFVRQYLSKVTLKHLHTHAYKYTHLKIRLCQEFCTKCFKAFINDATTYFYLVLSWDTKMTHKSKDMNSFTMNIYNIYQQTK